MKLRVAKLSKVSPIEALETLLNSIDPHSYSLMRQ